MPDSSATDWFSRHASGIQALASIASLVVAGVLAGLTARYVRLTKLIAESALNQVKHLKDAAVESRYRAARSLESLSRRVRVPLGQLDAAVPKHAQLLEYHFLTNADISDLESLARDVGDEAIRAAGKAAVSLRAILGIVEQARAVNRSTGWIAGNADAKNWVTAMDAGPKMLTALEVACKNVPTDQVVPPSKHVND